MKKVRFSITVNLPLLESLQLKYLNVHSKNIIILYFRRPPTYIYMKINIRISLPIITMTRDAE